MRITLTIELDLPDDIAEYPDIELRQLLFDSYTNYVPLQHIVACLDWMDKPAEDKLAPLIAAEHKKWFNITKDPKWSFKREV